MKSNNQYLENINESVTGQTVDERKPNNWYLRSIAKNTGSEEIHGHRTDNYYLRRIALNMEDLDVKELLETIAELRGEVEDLEEQLANDIHLFSCCKDIVQTGESLGLFAYCKADGEVEGNTVYFYAIDNTPIPSTITITSDKTVLSYSDNDKAVLTATVLDGDNNPLSDENVVFKIGSTVLDTVQTDNNGIAEYEYTSQGVGDVTFTVECMNLQETYELEDCLKVWGSISTTMDLNYTMPSTPFEVDYTFTRSEGAGYIRIGTDANNCILVGQVGGDGSNGLGRTNNGSYGNLQIATFKPTKNVPIDIKCKFTGSQYEYTISDETLTQTDVGQALTTLLNVYLPYGGTFSNLKIKPL